MRTFRGREEDLEIVAPDGMRRSLASPAGTDLRLRRADWVSEDGRTVLGLGEITSLPQPTNYAPMMWRC